MPRFFISFLTAIACVISTATLTSTVQAQLLPDTGDLRVLYDDTTGDLSLFYTGTGANGTAPLSIDGFNILTLGNGTTGATMPSGIPGVTAGQGGLNGTTAAFPTVTGFAIANTSIAGENGQYSEIGDLGFAPIIVFDKTNPGVSDLWNFGTVAPTGWTQDNINAIFITGQNSFASSLNFGKFSYLETGEATSRLGTVAVPEPSTAIALFSATLIAAASYRRRQNRRKQHTCTTTVAL